MLMEVGVSSATRASKVHRVSRGHQEKQEQLGMLENQETAYLVPMEQVEKMVSRVNKVFFLTMGWVN